MIPAWARHPLKSRITLTTIEQPSTDSNHHPLTFTGREFFLQGYELVFGGTFRGMRFFTVVKL